jgi:hypothetical protein
MGILSEPKIAENSYPSGASASLHHAKNNGKRGSKKYRELSSPAGLPACTNAVFLYNPFLQPLIFQMPLPVRYGEPLGRKPRRNAGPVRASNYETAVKPQMQK